jgi:hypothetical protein
MGLTIIVSSLFPKIPFVTPLISPFTSALSFLFFNGFAVSIRGCMSVASYSLMRKSSIVIGLFPSASYASLCTYWLAYIQLEMRHQKKIWLLLASKCSVTSWHIVLATLDVSD